MTTFDDIINYSPENKKVFEELSGLCINKMIVPHIGAGISVFAGFKTWNSFINDEYESCFHKKKPKKINNIVAADLIEQEQGNEVFYENVRTTFGGNLNDVEWKSILRKAENQAISVIPKLFSGPIVTTNFDQIIEKIHDNKLPVVFPYNSEELEKAVDNRKRLIYKIHGCVSDAQNVVFTKSVYDKVYSPDSELMKSLSVFFQGFHFLFLGSSLGVTNTKGDTKDYSMDVWEKLQNSGTYHFAILDCTEDQISTRREELEERNIYPILFESGKYESVKVILDELLARYENQLFGVPQYTSPFVERKESVLGKIANQLHDDEWSVLVITGFGGVGKTRILSEYANRKQKAYKHIICFNAISADNVREEIFQFVLKNKLIVDAEKDYNYIYYVFKKWMKENEDWLFLLDNVEHSDDIKVFSDFDETLKGKRHILISSRNKDEFSNIQTITIDVFEIEESREFLKSHTNKTLDEYADEIADCLGGLPLALEQAATYIKEENESYKEYFKLLEKDTISILEKKHLSHTESVGATWNISMQRIKSKAAKELLYLCAFFAPDNIHNQWFVDAIDVLPDELRKNGLNDFAEIKKELQTYSLVRIDNKDRISMHRLLQEVIKKTLKVESEKWFDYGINILQMRRFNNFSTVQSRFDFTEIIPHINFILSQSDKETVEIADLYYFMGIGYGEFANYPEALKYNKKALCIRKNILGEKHSDTSDTYNSIGLIYEKCSNFSESLKYCQISLNIEEELERIERIAILCHNVGHIYSEIGYYDDALDYYKKAIKIQKKRFGKNHQESAVIYKSMGSLYGRIGQINKALKYYKKALIINEKKLGKEHLITIYNYTEIGDIYSYKRKYSKSLKFHQQALVSSEKILGEEHPDTGTVYFNIARLYDNLNKKEALEYYTKALNICKKTHGDEHVNMGATYGGIGQFYYNLGNYHKALEYFNAGLNIYNNIFGIEHLSTSTVCYYIGKIYAIQSNYSVALKWLYQSYSVKKKILGENHYDCIDIWWDIRKCLKNANIRISFEEWLQQMQKEENDKNE